MSPRLAEQFTYAPITNRSSSRHESVGELACPAGQADFYLFCADGGLCMPGACVSEYEQEQAATAINDGAVMNGEAVVGRGSLRD